MLEPMKVGGRSGSGESCFSSSFSPQREIMMTKDIHEIMRLGWGKVALFFTTSPVAFQPAPAQIWHKCNSKFFPIPGEMTFKMGEHFEIELPHFGKAQVWPSTVYS
jgi:hypothetical protein